MKTTFVLSLVAASVLGSGLDRDQPAYAPADGTKLRRTFEAEASYERTSFSVTVDGEEPDVELPSYGWESTERIVVLDEIVEAADGRPLRIRRTFEELASDATFSSDAEEEDLERAQESGLEGATVVIRWDEDDEEYVFEADEDSDVDEDLLEGLDEDMDLRLLLPPKAVEVGDSWPVPGAAYLPLMWPGGLLAFHDTEQEEEDETSRDQLRQIHDSVDGEGEVTFLEVREEDGRKLAVLQVELEITAEAELELGEEGTVTMRSETERKIEGEVLWDLEAGHVRSATLEAESRRTRSTSGTFEGPQGSMEFEQEEVLDGEIRYAVGVEDVE